MAHNDQFFDFNELEYYNIDISEDSVYELDQQRNEASARKSEILMDHVPVSVDDRVYIPKLEQMGYRKYIVPISLFNEINEIFSAKDTGDGIATACVYIYRDILVFKKQGKVTGIVKICFNCWGNHIVGANTNTAAFGQEGDYARLQEVLKKVRS